jgi:translation initiation factor IF-2
VEGASDRRIPQGETAGCRWRKSSADARSLSREIAEGGVKELSVLIKADVQGSLEALQRAVAGIPSDKIRVGVLRASTGDPQADCCWPWPPTRSSSGSTSVRTAPRPISPGREEVEIRLYNVIPTTS